MCKAVITLPMMPVDGNNYGKYVTPIICEALKKVYGAKYYQCVNLLDSFNDRSVLLADYIKSLNENGIQYDELWIDSHNKKILLNNIKKLVDMGYISEKVANIYKCDCGVVEIEKSKIKTCNPNNSKFKYVGNDIYCKNCDNLCKKSEQKILIFTPKNIKKQDIIFLPRYLNKDAKVYEEILLNSNLNISRNRNTGIQLEYNNSIYNIDIDFFWGTYLANFLEDEKIIVGGNKMSYQLFLVGMLEKIFNPGSKTILLGTPYIENLRGILYNKNFIEENVFRKLTILFSMGYSKKNVKVDDSTMKYLKKLSKYDLELLYNIVCNQDEIKGNFVDSTEDVLKYQFNLQKSVQKMKVWRDKNV